nr:hypothetical protein [Desulfobacteraceae bacterium]
MQKAIQRYVLSKWGELVPGLPVPMALTTLQISQGHAKENRFGRVVHMLFCENSSTPVMVAKFCKDRVYENSLKSEAELFKKLVNSGIIGNIPRCLDVSTINGRMVIFEEAAPGTPFSVLAKNVYYRLGINAFKKTVLEHMDKASEFLIFLREATKTDGSGGVQDEIGRVISRYAGNKTLTGTEGYCMHGLARTVEGIIGKISSASMVHMDFIPANIFLSENGQIKVIDWEFASESRLCFLDTMRFIYYYYNILREMGVAGEDGFYETFISRSNWFSSLAFEFAAKVDGEIINCYEDFRTLFAFFLVFETGLQCEVSATWRGIYFEPFRELIYNLTGFSPLKELEDKNRTITEKDNSIADRDRVIADRDRVIAEKDNAIAEKNNAIAERDGIITDKDNLIAGLEMKRIELESV